MRAHVYLHSVKLSRGHAATSYICVCRVTFPISSRDSRDDYDRNWTHFLLVYDSSSTGTWKRERTAQYDEKKGKKISFPYVAVRRTSA
jgi:hypothetical protein